MKVRKYFNKYYEKANINGLLRRTYDINRPISIGTGQG